MSGIKLLSFDLDDTLWPCKPTILLAEETLYTYLQNRVPKITQQLDILQLRKKRQIFLELHPELCHNLSVLRVESLKALASEFSLEDDWVDEAFQVFYDARQKVTLFDDAVAALDQLHTDYRLVAVSNGNANIEKTGVGHWFEFSVSAADVGFMKPHPAIFEAVLERSNCLVDEVLHIGDDHNDVFGARQAGIRSVWLNRSDKKWQYQDCEADFHINSLAELPGLLEELKP